MEGAVEHRTKVEDIDAPTAPNIKNKYFIATLYNCLVEHLL